MKPQPRKARRSGSVLGGHEVRPTYLIDKHRRSTASISCERRKLLEFSGLAHADLDFTDPSPDNARTDGIPAYGRVALLLGWCAPQPQPASDQIRTMPLEERIQKSVDSALAGMRARIEDEVQSAIKQIITAAAAERDEAIAAAVAVGASRRRGGCEASSRRSRGTRPRECR